MRQIVAHHAIDTVGRYGIDLHSIVQRHKQRGIGGSDGAGRQPAQQFSLHGFAADIREAQTQILLLDSRKIADFIGIILGSTFAHAPQQRQRFVVGRQHYQLVQHIAFLFQGNSQHLVAAGQFHLFAPKPDDRYAKCFVRFVTAQNEIAFVVGGGTYLRIFEPNVGRLKRFAIGSANHLAEDDDVLRRHYTDCKTHRKYEIKFLHKNAKSGDLIGKFLEKIYLDQI